MNGDTIKALIVLGTLAIFGAAFAVNSAAGPGGLDQSAAIDNAEDFARKLSGDPAIEARVVDCNKLDTDNGGEGDGYNSCTFIINGKRTQVECANWAMFDAFANKGCREPKISIPRSTTSTPKD